MTTHLCIHGDVFTRTQRIVDWIASRTGWPVLTDRDLIQTASQRFGVSAARLERFLESPDGMLNRLTRGTERSHAYLQAVLADALQNETTIFHGVLGLMSPRPLPQMMHVLVTANPGFRVQRALHTTPANERQIRKTIHRRDRHEFQWCRQLFNGHRFDADAYDVVVPSDRLDREAAGRLILKQLVDVELRAADDASDRLADFQMAANIQVQLREEGYPVSVAAEKGHVRLTVEQPVLRLNRLTRKLERHVGRIDGVRQVEIRPGSEFFQADIYRRCRFEPSTEMAFKNFTQHRRDLHDRAVDQFPETSLTYAPREHVRAVNRMGATASP